MKRIRRRRRRKRRRMKRRKRMKRTDSVDIWGAAEVSRKKSAAETWESEESCFC